ncbi:MULTISPECIES: hypothetical protein [unclassified Bacillus (in: firmicutes)]|uniref:hypothetical protein n=1 Tax=Bacillus TaxID=1386 RepID=UPI0033903D92
MDDTLVKTVKREGHHEFLFINISSKTIGALSKESAEHILKIRDTDYIHQLMYVPIENDDDLKWFIQSLHKAIIKENDFSVVLELADLLYFFVVPFYKEKFKSHEGLSQLMNDMIFFLELWKDQEIIELVDAIQYDYKK